MYDGTFLQKQSLAQKRYNLEQNICILPRVLEKFLFPTSKTDLEYYYQKVNVRVASRVAKQLRDIIIPYNCLLKNNNFSIKTSNE